MLALRAALALFLAGCGTAVSWRARSLDLRHVLEVTADGARELAVLDGEPLGSFDAVAAGSVVFGAGGSVAFAYQAEGGWYVRATPALGPFVEIALPIRSASGELLFSAAQADGWHVVRGSSVGPGFAGVATEVQVTPDGRLVYVASTGSAERVVVGDVAGAPFDDVHLLALGDGGRHVVYAGRLGGRERVVVGETGGREVDEVLELVAARSAPAHAALLATGETIDLVHAAPDAEARVIATGTFLLGLRISDDGAHVACLSPSADGLGIELWLDGVVHARHRRIDVERLSFVPGDARLSWLSEDAQGIVVHAGTSESERFEEIEGPTLADGRIGFVGRRGGRSEVWIDGELVADETYATSLHLGGEHHGYVARDASGARFVVTRRGRWPIPRFFVDTLVLDESGEHWAALVPDSAERTFSVWVDGEPAADVPAAEILGPAVAAGIDPAEALVEVVRAVLGTTLAVRPSE